MLYKAFASSTFHNRNFTLMLSLSGAIALGLNCKPLRYIPTSIGVLSVCHSIKMSSSLSACIMDCTWKWCSGGHSEKRVGERMKLYGKNRSKRDWQIHDWLAGGGGVGKDLVNHYDPMMWEHDE